MEWEKEAGGGLNPEDVSASLKGNCCSTTPICWLPGLCHPVACRWEYTRAKG